jgi:TolB-like protein/DNA-binding winged helix-turn-helix (wHTH) protein/Tfp pilus assembly protein PilF
MTATDSLAIRIGAWRVDPALDEISKDGNTVKLERRAMQLLVFLSKHADQVVSVEQLLDEVWAGVVVTPDSVYQAVSALRRMLGDDSHDPTYIATVPRRGYRLIAPVAPWIDVPRMPVENPVPPALEAAPATLVVTKTGLSWRRIAIVVSAAFALAAAYVVVDRGWLPKHALIPEHPPTRTATVVDDKSIAVLPFVDMSEKHDQEYFGDGMAEEILDLLAKIPGLTVIGRTSSFQFKGKNEDLRSIGTKLNAAYVLEGSLRNSGDQVRITAQLINTRTGAQEWSETYDRHIGDVLKLQDAIAAVVVRELQLTVAPQELSSRATIRNAEAYDLYLRGRHAMDRNDSEGLDEAVTLFQRALDRDPTFADAAAALAITYINQVALGSLAPAAGFEQARSVASSALKLNSSAVRARVSMAWIHMMCDLDWAGADRELRQAAALAPSDAQVLKGQAELSADLGHLDDALKQIKTAVALDPLDVDSLEVLSNIQDARGNLREAEATMRRAMDIRPTYAFGHYNLGLDLLEGGDDDGALREMQQETIDEEKLQGLALIFYALGRKTDADAALAALIKEQANENALDIAQVYAFRSQSDEAMHWLERAYAQKDPWLFRIKTNWLMKGLEADPRYKTFLRKMNFPEQRQGRGGTK